MPIDVYEKQQAEFELLSILLESERDRLAGAPVKTVDKMREELEAFYTE